MERHLLCLSWVVLVFTGLLDWGVKTRTALGKAEGCSGRGSPGSCCSVASSLVPEPWRARLGSKGRGKAYVWWRRWLGPSTSCCWLALCYPIPGSRNSKSDSSRVSHQLEQPRLDPWAAKFNFACTTGGLEQGRCGSCCPPWCWWGLEKEVLCKCCLIATSCWAQPHSKATSLESVQDCSPLSSLSHESMLFFPFNFSSCFQERSWAEYQVVKWKWKCCQPLKHVKKLALSSGSTLMCLHWVPLLWESVHSGHDSEKSLNGFVVCSDGV